MTRRAWPVSLQHLLASTTNACKCGAELEPLDGFVCGPCREARRVGAGDWASRPPVLGDQK
jgi:hypothetical protein